MRNRNVANIECPLFFPLGGKWVLIVSQSRPVQWFVGDLDTARIALEGLVPDGSPDDATLLLARGSLAFYQGDLDAAAEAAAEARRRVSLGAQEWQLFDLVTLQGLVENAIKHGMRAHAGAFAVGVRSWLEGDALTIEVDNPGKLRAPFDPSQAGVGLTNMYQRLALRYPGRHSFARNVPFNPEHRHHGPQLREK